MIMKIGLGVVLVCILILFGLTLNWDQTEDAMNSDADKTEHTNHLINSNSPYLLSHAHNSVDWYPWGEEALARARELDRPIFLSVGYAACHWCHVMERESFENDSIAQFLNDHFVAIKVDREERPDIDQIYMAFTQALSGSGGWPMSVFLTPDLKPFFAGTYFPPDDRYGRPGFMSVLTQIASAYDEAKEQITTSSKEIFEQMALHLEATVQPEDVSDTMMAAGARALLSGFDHTYGGFGRDQKFPHATELSLFLRHYQNSGAKEYLEAANQGLTAMYRGGLRDHLGGGFARYSVDPQWKIPHFEKMLYDNALLTCTYAEAWQLTERAPYRDAVVSTLDFILNEMTDQAGGFYSALDADSEGEEGKYYVWSKAELKQILGEDTETFCEYYSASSQGNFEGKNHLQLNPASERVASESGIADWDSWLANCKERLLAVRASRVRPPTDDKILASWNGLALAAFARGYQITGDRRYLEAAVRNAEFVKERMYINNQLRHTWRNGQLSSGEFLEDYAYYLFGLMELAQTDAERSAEWIRFATELADRAIELFMDENGVIYLREAGLDDLIIRPKEEFDGALPSAGSILIGSLLKLNRLTDQKSFLEAAERGLRALSPKIKGNAGGMASGLIALDYYFGEKIELVLIGPEEQTATMLHEVNRRFIPNKLIALSHDGSEPLPLFEGRQVTDGRVVAYLCRNSVCNLPAGSATELAEQLDRLTSR